MPKPLSTNGLIMPMDFPADDYDSIHRLVEQRARNLPNIYEHFGGAWNAQAYRFLAATTYGDSFCKSLARAGAGGAPDERYGQERDLFGFFSNGFSAFEASFYGLFALGAIVSPTEFPLATPKDQQRISPAWTTTTFSRAFPGDPLNNSINSVLADAAYLEWRDVRNILTHRAAPGRTFFVGAGGDDEMPAEWKIKSIPLDANMVPSRRAELSRLLATLMREIDRFAKSRL